ncbi:MAG: alkyl hydroperoxide reductase, partial [Planctomycetales bacterium]|nr:alkyl hydroperoxide reductase [Planctomycetales bacterium]
GMEQDDLTEVGLLFGRSPEITHEVLTLLAVNQEFEIPPEARRHTVQASTNRLPRAGELLAITPHMHFRGSSFELRSAARPDEILLSVPRYDFNWQHTYQLREPLPLDGLEALQFTASFDNSSHNPFNPDPAQTVSWGEQSWEEMAVAFFDVASPLQQPAAAESAAGLGPSRGTAADQPQVLAYVERVMKTLDTNGDGVIKKAEAGIVVRHLHFGLWDLDGDNVATLEEVRTVAQRLYLK